MVCGNRLDWDNRHYEALSGKKLKSGSGSAVIKMTFSSLEYVNNEIDFDVHIEREFQKAI